MQVSRMIEHGKNILIVEDDVQVQILYRYLLPASYQLMITDTVLGAKEILKIDEIDCVILDLALVGAKVVWCWPGSSGKSMIIKNCRLLQLQPMLLPVTIKRPWMLVVTSTYQNP